MKLRRVLKKALPVSMDVMALSAVAVWAVVIVRELMR